MGEDKAGIDPYEQGPLIDIGIRALRSAGLHRIAVIGARESIGVPAGVDRVPDVHPDEGPLGGIITALEWATSDLVVVMACDMPFLTGTAVEELIVRALRDPSASVVLAELDGRPQPLTAVWRSMKVLETLRGAFDAGERAPRRVLERLVTVTVVPSDPDSLIDIDSPSDIERYAAVARRRTTEG